MERSSTTCKKQTVNPKKARYHTQQYFLTNNGVKPQVCQQLNVKLFQVSMKRLYVIQSKILENLDFREIRGVHTNIPHKLKDKMYYL